MASKALLVLTGVLMVALLLVSFDVPAAAAAGAEEHQQVTEKATSVGGVGESKQRCRCCRWYGGRCQRYCCYNGEEFDVDVEAEAVGGVGESKKQCRCCGGWYHGRCKRYCCYNGEVFNVDVGAETEPHN